MKERIYNSKDLQVVCLCSYIPREPGCVTKNVLGYYIAQLKKKGIYKARLYTLLTKNRTCVQSAKDPYFVDDYGVEVAIPLSICAKNLPDKISHSQVIDLEKQLSAYFREHEDEIRQFIEYEDDCYGEDERDEYGGWGSDDELEY